MKKLFFLAAIAALSVCCTNQLDVNSNEAIRNKVINHRNNQFSFTYNEDLDSQLFDSQELEDMTSNYFGDDGITHGSSTIDYIYSTDFYPVFEQLLPIIDPYLVAPANQIEVPTIALAVVNYSNTGYAVYIPYKDITDPLIIGSNEGNIDFNLFNLQDLFDNSNISAALDIIEISQIHYSWAVNNNYNGNWGIQELYDFYTFVSAEILKFEDIDWGMVCEPYDHRDTAIIAYNHLPNIYTFAAPNFVKVIADLLYNLNLSNLLSGHFQLGMQDSPMINADQLTLQGVISYLTAFADLYYIDGQVDINNLNVFLSSNFGIQLVELTNLQDVFNIMNTGKYAIRNDFINRNDIITDSWQLYYEAIQVYHDMEHSYIFKYNNGTYQAFQQWSGNTSSRYFTYIYDNEQ